MTKRQGQIGLEDHYEQWFEHIASDFRATSLNELVLSLTPPGRVLDLGCGSGALSAELWRRGRKVVSQDMSERMVAMCERHLRAQGFGDAEVRLGGVETVSERGDFDAVVALDVIEHIDDDEAALVIMREALTPDGTLVLSVPAMSRLFGPKDVEVGHYRRYDREPLLEVVRRAGFEVQTCRFWNVLGVAPVWVSNLRNKRLDESVRYSRSRLSRALNSALRGWFRVVENPLRPPLGLTLLLTARPAR